MKKYNNEILDSIVENWSKFTVENTLEMSNIDDKEILMMKKGAKIHIKPENKGKLTKSAKQAGKSVQQHARDVMKDPNATALQKRRANFAIQSKKWHHK